MNIRSFNLKLLTGLLLSIAGVQLANAQYVYKIKADTVRIYNTCDTAELVLQNRTQNVLGFLYNKGGGVTEFRALNSMDTAFRSNDTLYYRTSAGNIVPIKIGMTAAEQSGAFILNQSSTAQNANFDISGNGTLRGGRLLLANAGSNYIQLSTAGTGIPQVNTRSAGEKLVLYPSLSPANADFAFGIEGNNMWMGIPHSGSVYGIKFYADSTPIGRIDAAGNAEWVGRGRFSGSSSSNQIVGGGPAAEIHYKNGSALFQGYDRTAGGYIPTTIVGGVGNTTKSLILDATGYQLLNLPNVGLLGTDASGYLKEVSANENLNTIVHRGNTTDASININPQSNAFRSLLIYRNSDTAITYSTFGNNKTAATVTFIPDTSKLTKAYNMSVGAGTLTYYNAGITENILRDSNHPAGSNATTTFSGAQVPAVINSNNAGHLTSITMRTLTPADISAAPAADYVSRSAGITNPQAANVFNADLNTVTNTAVFHIGSTATNGPVSGIPGYMLSMGNVSTQSVQKGQLLLSYNIEDGLFFRMGSNTSWNPWYQVASRAWANANLAPINIPLSTVLSNGNTANSAIAIGSISDSHAYDFKTSRLNGAIGYSTAYGVFKGMAITASDGTAANNKLLLMSNDYTTLQYSPNNGTNYYDVWHSGNDGSGSGLDADLLDGINSSGFIGNQIAAAQTANFWVNGYGVASTLNAGTATGTIQFATHNGVFAANGTNRRWSIYHSTTEAAGNVGNDFNIGRYDNTGAFISSTLTIQRSTGNIGIATQTPAQKLDVAGSIAASTSVITPTVTTQTINSGGGTTSLSLQSGSTLTLNPGTSMVNVNGSVVATGYLTAGTALTVTSGSVQLPCQTVTASTPLAGSYTTFVNTSGITLTLLAASSCKGRIYEIVNSSTGAITISSVLVFGTATTSIPAKTSWRIQSDGTNWQLLSRSN